MKEPGRRVERLRASTAITALFERGRSGSCREVMVRLLPREGECPRAAVIAAKRLGTAVERNRIRRRLRAAVRELAASFPPADVAVVARRKLDASTHAALVAALAAALDQAWKGRR